MGRNIGPCRDDLCPWQRAGEQGYHAGIGVDGDPGVWPGRCKCIGQDRLQQQFIPNALFAPDQKMLTRQGLALPAWCGEVAFARRGMAINRQPRFIIRPALRQITHAKTGQRQIEADLGVGGIQCGGLCEGRKGLLGGAKFNQRQPAQIMGFRQLRLLRGQKLGLRQGAGKIARIPQGRGKADPGRVERGRQGQGLTEWGDCRQGIARPDRGIGQIDQDTGLAWQQVVCFGQKALGAAMLARPGQQGAEIGQRLNMLGIGRQKPFIKCHGGSRIARRHGSGGLFGQQGGIKGRNWWVRRHGAKVRGLARPCKQKGRKSPAGPRIRAVIVTVGNQEARIRGQGGSRWVEGPMQIVAIIQARFSSARLPGKVLKPLAGRPMLGHLIARLKRAAGLYGLILATSTEKSDDPVAEFGAGQGIRVHRGPLDDVAGRMVAAATAAGAEALVRISGDSPFMDPAIVSERVARFAKGDLDLATNVAVRSFPKGQSVEVISRDVLEKLLARSHDPADREHVTPWFYRNPDQVRIDNAVWTPPRPALQLSVDTAEEFSRAEQIIARLGPAAETAGLADLIAAHDALFGREAA